MKIKNTATEKFCNEVAVIYWKESHVNAMKVFQKWCDENKPMKWEYIVMVERIKELILEKKGTL